MIRLSAGTAACLGLSSTRMDAFPTTAYLLSGRKCLMKCSFCPQGTGSNEALNRLGRVNWPEYSWPDVEKSLRGARERGLERVCLQSVRHGDGIESLLGIIARLKNITDLPLSLSAWIGDEEEASTLLEAGVERISLSLDVINPLIFEQVKGGPQHSRLALLLRCAEAMPGKISTHLICGLGETEAEALSLIDRLLKAGVTVALFAFVPLKGTALENKKPPPVSSYRRIQAGYYLLRDGAAEVSSFNFLNGRLRSFGLRESDLRARLSGGSAFQTSGCPGCNRPFYNERPGGIIYNYHRQLEMPERETALDELLFSLGNGSRGF